MKGYLICVEGEAIIEIETAENDDDARSQAIEQAKRFGFETFNAQILDSHEVEP